MATCSKECDKCIYGVPQKMYKCNNPNSTCNRVCSNCEYASDKTVRWYCIMGDGLREKLEKKLDHSILYGINS